MFDLSEEISRKILFVDDELLLLEGIKRQLRREFDLTVASSGSEALATLASHGPFAVVVSDFNMPGMDGISFLNRVYHDHPDTVLMMLTGRAELDVAVNALHSAHIARFLNKPCPKELLQETLTDGLEQYRLRISERLLQIRLRQANAQLAQLNENLESLVLQKTRALRLQYDYVAEMARMNNSGQIVDTFLSAVRQLTSLSELSLWLSPRLDGRYSLENGAQLELRQFSIGECGEGVVRHALSSRKRWFCQQSTIAISHFDRQLFQRQPCLSQPLVCNHYPVGLLNLSGPAEIADFDDSILDALAGMADVTATALQSHWHQEAFTDAQDAIITALAKLSEYRDPETGAHLLRLKKYSSLLCEYLTTKPEYRGRVDAEFTRDLVRSSPLHDIGKVGIADAILKKPGKLTAEEFEIMKQHATIGGDTLRTVFEQYPSQNFIKCGMEIAYGHHEKWDGSGYPFGLKGEEIALSARILALVDVYDALTCRRVYKEPFPRAKANAIILEGRGVHFDPALVDAFLCIEERFHQIAEEFVDHF